MGDVRAAALNRRPFTKRAESAQYGGRDDFVAPARGNDIRKTSAETGVRELHRRRRQCGEYGIRAENDDRHDWLRGRLRRRERGHGGGHQRRGESEHSGRHATTRGAGAQRAARLCNRDGDTGTVKCGPDIATLIVRCGM